MSDEITAEVTDQADMVELSFAAWPANTEIRLTNVPWDQQYRHVSKFPSKSALNTYLDGRSGKNITSVSYHRVGDPLYLQDPFNVLWKYNYLRVSQPAQPTTAGENDTARDYYYFIVDVRHVAPNTTQLVLSLDTFQTFIYDTVIGRSFIERGHIAQAEGGTMNDQGRRYLSAPEGLDTGGSYITVLQANESLITASSDYLIYATADLEGDFGVENAPKTPTVQPRHAFDVASGIGVWVASSSADVRVALANLPAWISQTIIAIMAVPKLTQYYPGYSYDPISSTLPLSPPPAYRNNTPLSSYGTRSISLLPPTWRDAITTYLPPRYAHLEKFKTHPYSDVIVHHGASNTLTLRPEFCDTFGLYVRSELSPHLGDGQLRAHPLKYNNLDHDQTLFVTSGDLPRIGSTNDTAAIALSANARSRAFASSNASWAQDKALRGNQNSYDAVSRGMDAAQAQQDLSVSYANDQQARGAQWATEDAWIGGGMGVAQGAAGGAAGGALLGPAGAVVGGLIGAGTGALNGFVNLQKTDIANRRSAESTSAANAQGQSALNINQGVTGAGRDANKSLADWAARGDYQATIAGQLAAVQDTEAMAPSVGAMPSGSLDAAARGRLGITALVKMIDYPTIVRIGEFWLRYGYAIGEYITPPQSLRVMSNFSYWKMGECELTTAPMPESMKNTLRGIFEKGVTNWANPDLIGTDADNAPIYGSYY